MRHGDQKMLALIQRVTSATVTVNNTLIAEIGQGILALIGIEKTDTDIQATRLLERIIHYRIFQDNADKMNLSLQDIAGGLLLVPQFTLVADTKKGTRPGFSTAMPPAESEKLFTKLIITATTLHQPLATGKFGAHMQITLCNDGPVTFLLQIN
jgi:D-tyrosyl-tRNA(Tyr) deacylase